MQVPFFDLEIQNQTIKEELDEAIASVFDAGIFIGGNAVTHFENQWAATLGIKHCVGVANGTDALEILLQAFGVGPGDEVIVPSHTWVSTAEAVISAGAIPVFVDSVDLFYTLDVTKIASLISIRTKAIIPVHLAGLSVDMNPVMELASQHGLMVIEDCAQSHLAQYHGAYTGTLGHAAAFSFYPTKNLGAFGDAGAIVTNDDAIAMLCRQLANHGQSKRDEHLLPGRNSRLDSLQASMLSAKLKHLQQWTALRAQHAVTYRKLLDKRFLYTPVPDGYVHAYHLFLVQVDHRSEVMKYLLDNGVDTRIHYPFAVPDTKAFEKYRSAIDSYPVNKRYTNRILSLPIFPELTSEQIVYVCEKLNNFL